MRMLSPVSVGWSLPRRELDQIFDSFLQPTSVLMEGFTPKCDVNETKNHFFLSFDLPGLKKEEIKIEVQDNVLTVSGERVREQKDENDESTWHYEKSYGRFERSFTLPAIVAAEKIEAHFENGVLNVSLPKAEVAKGRTIQIQ